MTTPTTMQRGWYPDPAHRHEDRYWDGANWTALVSDNGVTASDPLESPPSPTPPPRRGGPGRMANWAVCLGGMSLGLAWILILGTQAGTEGWGKLGLAAIIITTAVSAAPGLVLGILTLVLPAPGCDLRRRRIMASIGIGLALLGSTAVFFIMQAIDSSIPTLRDGISTSYAAQTDHPT